MRSLRSQGCCGSRNNDREINLHGDQASRQAEAKVNFLHCKSKPGLKDSIWIKQAFSLADSSVPSFHFANVWQRSGFLKFKLNPRLILRDIENSMILAQNMPSLYLWDQFILEYLQYSLVQDNFVCSVEITWCTPKCSSKTSDRVSEIVVLICYILITFIYYTSLHGVRVISSTELT